MIYLYRDDAEMEYLKIAQDLEMYGVNYFQIKVCKSVICVVPYLYAPYNSLTHLISSHTWEEVESAVEIS